jgi:hypothetical protein
MSVTTIENIQQSVIAYYASLHGGRVAFNITTGIVPLASGTSEQALALLVNPADSGYDLYLDVGEFGCSINATFRRYRGATLSSLSSPISANNMGGGSGTSVAQMYIGGTGATYTRSGGTVAKTAHIAAYQQYLTNLGGRVVIRPGNHLVWTITAPSGNSNNFTGSVYFEYWELPAA